MRLFTLLLNLAKRIASALTEAKDYTDARGDYIVEEGTSGIWYYRKWASGAAECWGTQTETKASYVTLGNNWYGFNTTSVSLPFTFLQTPNVNTSIKIGSSLSFASPLISVSTTAVNAYGMAYGQSTSTTVIVNYQVKGLWKAFTQVGGVILNHFFGRVVTA